MISTNHTISIGVNIHQSKMSTSTFNDVINSIKNDMSLKLKVEAIRSCDDKDKKKKLKEELPYFILGQFEDNVRGNNNLISTNFMILDHLNTEQMKEVKNKLQNDDNVLSCFLSPSGTGYKVIYNFVEAITKSNHFTKNYNYYAEQFEEEYGITTDNTKDAARACFFSCDPDLYLNANAKSLEVIAADDVVNKAKTNKKDPKSKKDITKNVNNLLKKYPSIEGPYWLIKDKQVNLLVSKYIDFLTDNGFAKVYYGKSYIYIRVNDNIAEELEISNIKDFVIQHVKSIENDSKIYRDDIREKLLNGVNKYFGDGVLGSINTTELNMRMDTRTFEYIFYKNGYVVAGKDAEPQINPYTTLTNPIWKSRILDREFDIIPIKYKQSEYERFLWNVSRQNDDRFTSMCSAIGYLLHGYKDKSTPKAIITVDEKVSDNPDGRSGKSLYGDAISRMKQSVRIDGKNFEFNPRFTFQEVDISTEIVDFNDVKKNFDFEKLFSVLTDDMSIEYKSKTPIKISFAESPKIMVSTNYTIKGKGGSHKDRMFELEFSDHYNVDHEPKDEFGHLFFEDWDDEEWNRFDNFMLECLMLYLDEGLVICHNL